MSLKKVTDEVRRCSDVMGSVDITLLLYPFVSKFLSALTQTHPMVTYRRPKFTSTAFGKFVHVLVGIAVFAGNPNSGANFFRSTLWFFENILQVLLCPLSSS